MAAATKDRPRERGGVPIGTPPLGVAAATTIFGGTLVCKNAAGNAVPAAVAAGNVIQGVAVKQVDNSGGAAGDKSVVCERGCIEPFDISGGSLDETDIGLNVFAADDQSVSNTAVNAPAVGTLLGIVGGKAMVHVGVFAAGDAP